ncbi:polysaccharide deacetylase family protein [Boudabousia liubingyangii]|nr:polysaccharide deacetylase family protein [Boudabousia liubingyangii]
MPNKQASTASTPAPTQATPETEGATSENPKSTPATPEKPKATVEPSTSSAENPTAPSNQAPAAPTVSDPATSAPQAPAANPPGFNSPDGGPDCEKVKCVAFTFDDGPGEYTEATLKALKEAGIKATFFQMGRNVAAHPELTKKVVAEGHALGGHSWNHPQLTKLNDKQASWQITATNDAIKAALGHGSNMMRPPYGAFNHRIRTLMKNLNQASILWSVDSLDWKYLDADKSIEYIHQQLGPGGIILMHDIHPVAAKVIPVIVKEYQAKGYHFVTIPQLFKSKGLKPGFSYFKLEEIRGLPQ